jgi:hypothetical protein
VEEVEADQARKVAVAEVFATCVTLGFRSFLESVGGAGEGAACAGLADGTLGVDSMTLAAVEQTTGVEGTAIVGELALMHRVCSTCSVASDQVVARRLAFHVDHAVVTAQTQASLTVACGKRWEGSPADSLLRPP